MALVPRGGAVGWEEVVVAAVAVLLAPIIQSLVPAVVVSGGVA